VIQIPEEDGGGDKAVVITFFYEVVGVVLAQDEEGALGDSQELVVCEVLDVGGDGEGVDEDEYYEDEPEEGEGVELEMGEEGESQHLQETLFLWFYLFVEEAAGEGRLVIE